MNQDLDKQINQLCAQDKITIPGLQQTLNLDFCKAGTIIAKAIQLKLIKSGDIIKGYKILNSLGLKIYFLEILTSLKEQDDTTGEIINQKVNQICINNKLYLHDLQQNFQLSFGRAGDLVDDAILLKILNKNGNINDGFKILNMSALKTILRKQLSCEFKNRYRKWHQVKKH